MWSEKKKSNRRPALLGLLLLSTGALQSCYVAEQSYHHLRNYFSQVPIEEAIKEPKTAKYADSLRKVGEIKKFAVERIHLSNTESYSDFLEVKGEGITHNVTASAELTLTPYTWWFPVVGSVPYKGYFSKEKMRAEAEKLELEGYDVWTFSATAYSTLGFFDDPVNSVMLRSGLPGLAETIIHEMVHETVYLNGETKFNEQLASFVGQKGMEQFLLTQPNGEDILEALKKRRVRYALFRSMMNQTYAEADAIYGNPGANDDEKRAKKKELFEKTAENIRGIYPNAQQRFLTLNNARLLQYRRYDEQSLVFAELWQKSGEDWQIFWNLLNTNLDAYVSQVNSG